MIQTQRKWTSKCTKHGYRNAQNMDIEIHNTIKEIDKQLSLKSEYEGFLGAKGVFEGMLGDELVICVYVLIDVGMCRCVTLVPPVMRSPSPPMTTLARASVWGIMTTGLIEVRDVNIWMNCHVSGWC